MSSIAKADKRKKKTKRLGPVQVLRPEQYATSIEGFPVVVVQLNGTPGKGTIPIRRCSMEIQRRQDTAEFKRDAVALVMEQGSTMTRPPRI